MYKFVKIKFNHEKEGIDDWFFMPETVEDVELHWEKYCKQDLINSMPFKYDDATNILSSIISGFDTTESIGDIMNDFAEPTLKTMKQRRIDIFKNNKNILLSRGGQCVDIPLDLITITKVNESQVFEYPN